MENVCKSCNNSLGETVEGSIMECLFFACGIEKTGLKNKEDAYKRIPIVVEKTGQRLKFVSDNLWGSAVRPSMTQRIAPPKEMRKLVKGDVRKRLPKWLDWYDKQLKAGEKRIQLPGEIQEFSHERKRARVVFESRLGFPVKLLAKIAYEGMIAAGVFTEDSLRQFFESCFRVDLKDDGKTTVVVADDFGARVRWLSRRFRGDKVDYFSFTYREVHSIDFRLSKRQVAYLKIIFFGLLPCIVLVGKVKPEMIPKSRIIGQRAFFPFKGAKCVTHDLPEEILTVKQGEDALADASWDYFCKKSKPQGF